ncbi:hypothetical protein DFH28DRAFT_929650 [Melampsora americana]|nr:hypothetical protein DFH28DRAFT_929650 [Melampsora americana]
MVNPNPEIEFTEAQSTKHGSHTGARFLSSALNSAWDNKASFEGFILNDGGFWSASGPIFTSVPQEACNSLTQVSHPSSKETHIYTKNTAEKETVDLFPVQHSEYTEKSEPPTKYIHNNIPDLNAKPPYNDDEEVETHTEFGKNDVQDKRINILDRQIISIPNFSSDIPDKELASASKDIVHKLQIAIIHILKHGLKPLELKEAKKIWNSLTVLPFVYFVISHDINSEISKKAIRLVAVVFAAYHQKFLLPYMEIDYDNLARFLAWTTDIFHQITSPRLIFNSSTESKEEQSKLLGRTRYVHPVARAILVLRGHEFNGKIFCAKHCSAE